jgi:beta-glucosidase
MAMPNDQGFWGANLTAAVRNGSVPESRLDDMATRIIASWYQMGQDSASYPAPGIGMPNNILSPHTIVDARNPASKPTLLQAAIEGHVLVKNSNNALPLKSLRMLSLYGYDAKAVNNYGPSSSSGWSGGEEVTDASLLNCHASPCPAFTYQHAGNGTIISGGGSGAVTPPYISSPFDALLQESMASNTALFWDFDNVNSTGVVDPASDACLVFINAFATEGHDRPGLHDDHSDALVLNIASQCNNTIVIIHNAGIRLVDTWISHANITAVLFAHLPGQDSGRALVEILYGRSSPSGKLPYTVARNESDYGSLYTASLPSGAYTQFPQSNFSEGVLIDYRAFDANNITPRFEFGFGKTYTTFNYSALSCSSAASNLSVYPVSAVIPGGQADLFDTVATVSASVTNTGSVAAAEVAQLYVGSLGEGQPVKQLRGFEKVFIEPGQTVTVQYGLCRKDLSTWDVEAQSWKLAKGEVDVFVGASSRDLPLTGRVMVS